MCSSVAYMSLYLGGGLGRHRNQHWLSLLDSPGPPGPLRFWRSGTSLGQLAFHSAIWTHKDEEDKGFCWVLVKMCGSVNHQLVDKISDVIIQTSLVQQVVGQGTVWTRQKLILTEVLSNHRWMLNWGWSSVKQSGERNVCSYYFAEMACRIRQRQK